MDILVTGGAGFIGSNLCRDLVIQPFVSSVSVIDDFSSGLEQNLDGLEVTLFKGNILDQSLLKRACAGKDAIVHLAARSSVPRSIDTPVLSHDVNVNGTVALLEQARHNQSHFVFASSSSVYGANQGLPKSESLVPRPMSPYAASKLAAESYTLAWANSFNLDVLALRFFNVYGPRQTAGGQYSAVIPEFMRSALLGDSLRIFGDGRQTRDFTFVENVTDVIVEALRNRVANETPVNLAFGTRVSLLQLVDMIANLPGIENPMRSHFPARVGDVKESCADPTRLLQLFPSLTAVPLAEGLLRTFEWISSSKGS